MSNDFELPKNAETKANRGRSAVNQVTVKDEPKDSAPKEENKNEDVTPAEKAKPKYDPNELAAIFDDIIFTGDYSEEVVIKGKLRVKFKSRTAEETSAISSDLDSTPANLVATLQEKRSILNLQYALMNYQGKDLSTLKLDNKIEFINKLAAPIVGALITALSKFDSKVYAACTEGEENF